MSKQYIRPCPVRLIGRDLREENFSKFTPIYPCAIAADLDASIWLVECDCGIEFKTHADRLLNQEVTSCGQCVDTDTVQSEVAYLELSDCYDLLKFG